VLCCTVDIFKDLRDVGISLVWVGLFAWDLFINCRCIYSCIFYASGAQRRATCGLQRVFVTWSATKIYFLHRRPMHFRPTFLYWCIKFSHRIDLASSFRIMFGRKKVVHHLYTQPTTSVQSYKIPRLRLITLSFLIVVCINLQLYGHDKFLFVKVMNVNEVTLYILFCCSVASKWTTGQRRNTTVQLLALQSSTPTASAATHFVTDRRTDKHTDDIIMPTADHTPV